MSVRLKSITQKNDVKTFFKTEKPDCFFKRLRKYKLVIGGDALGKKILSAFFKRINKREGNKLKRIKKSMFVNLGKRNKNKMEFGLVASKMAQANSSVVGQNAQKI